MDFFQGKDTHGLLAEYGSPLYVYNEDILRERCREMVSLCKYKNFKVNYSVKANANVAFLQIVRQEGLNADAMSPGEITSELAAGFLPEEIFFIANNVSAEEMRFAVERGITVSADSLSQLETFGKINRGGEVSVRINPGIGDGHHEKVITGGKKTKFAINYEDAPQMERILDKYSLRLVGINQHIGSHFMTGENYLKAMDATLSFAKKYKGLEFIDVGGGFGIPYEKQTGETRLDLAELGREMDIRMERFAREYGHEVAFKIEPGRYIAAEAGALLGTVYAIKENCGTKYVGTDLGFNVLVRPMLYDAHHDITVYSKGTPSEKTEAVTVVGNICESGDIIAHDRLLPEIAEGDVLAVMDAGAYGFSMSSSYNNRPRPAEIILRSDGEVFLARERETLTSLIAGCHKL
ncbi:diaminopimelate decarboxylase [Clostridia bacterium]|nr:diaminopimelate decarboxylase [Clostridia bacterium]